MQREFELFLERLSASVDDIDLRDAMTSLALEFNLRSFAYLSWSNRLNGEPTLISNYPAKWTSQYMEGCYYRHDPVIVRARSGGRTFLWGADDAQASRSSSQRQFFEKAAQFEIRCGLTIPIVDRRGGFATVTLAADEPNPTFVRSVERYEQALRLIGTCFHIHARRKLVGDRSIDGVTLTPREFECLQWAARGKSYLDIGCILGIKRRTAAFHLDNVRKKLGVRTITQAIAMLASSQSTFH